MLSYLLKNNLTTSVAIIAPIIWAKIKPKTLDGLIPLKLSVNILPIVTAGFAKLVDEVNQYPAVINKATPIAIFSLFTSFNIKIVNNNPTVAIISEKNLNTPTLSLSDHSIIGYSKYQFAVKQPNIPAIIWVKIKIIP